MSTSVLKPVRYGSMSWSKRPGKVKAPKRPKPPPPRKPKVPDRFKKKQCHRKAYKAWIATFYNPATGHYEWRPGVHQDWPTWWRNWLDTHVECRA